MIEVKYSDSGRNLEKDCMEALKQIEQKDYCETFRQKGIRNILQYGIACHTKTCKVISSTPVVYLK